MLTIEVSPQNLAELRFAYSPLLETVFGYRIMISKKPPQPPYKSWVDSARQATHDLEFPYLSALLSCKHFIPDFLTVPPTQNLTMESGLAALTQTPPEVVQKYVKQLVYTTEQETEITQHYLAYPSESLQCLGDELYTFWRRTLATEWTQITSVLDGDILFRARQLAINGVEKMLRDLDSTRLLYEPTKFQLLHWGHKDQQTTFGSGGLQLVPTAFPMGIMFQIAVEWNPVLWYQARGIAQWKQETPQHNQSLELLLGAARAEVLQALAEPATTSELARRLHLTAGAISQHLDRLQRTGLVESTRSGKRVYYRLAERGRGLLRLFDVVLL